MPQRALLHNWTKLNTDSGLDNSVIAIKFPDYDNYTSVILENVNFFKENILRYLGIKCMAFPNCSQI